MIRAALEMKALSTKPQEASVSNRILGFSYLRALACIAIITLHTVNVAEILYRNQITDVQRTASLAVVYCLMWAVPCFVMVTGALLLNPARRITLRKIFNSYIVRVLGALLLFGLVFRVFDIVMNGEELGIASVLLGFVKVFTGQSWAHLWYLYLLIGLYLMLPFYRMAAKESSPSLLRYLLAISVIFLSLLPLTRMFGVSSAFYLHVSTIYPFYLFAGYAIYSGAVTLHRGTATALTICSTAAIAALTVYYFYAPAESLDAILTSYSSILIILQAAGLFSLFAQTDSRRASHGAPTALEKLLLFIDQNSFGTYLIHMIFIRLVLRYMAVNPYQLGLWSFPLLVIGNLILSCLITWILRKIPGLKKIL